MSHHLNNILLVGTGPMAVEYVKVLKDLPVNFSVIGRSVASGDIFESKTQIKPLTGGLEENLSDSSSFDGAIICTGVEQLANCTLICLEKGIKNILVEKPAALTIEELEEVAKQANRQNAQVWIAYNRRFYASVLNALELIKADGGVSSFNFEFTEWSHTIEPLQKAAGVKEKWLLANSSHVIDLAFFMGGEPVKLTALSDGELSWHSKSKFAGVGMSNQGSLFDYRANWNAPGRWGVEILTEKNRYIFRPLEDLQVQTKGSVQILKREIDNSLDTQYKAGLFLQTQYWISGEKLELFLDIYQQVERFEIYKQILQGNHNDQ